MRKSTRVATSPTPHLRRILIGLFVLILLPARPAGAWIDTGHRVIALIAWADLTPAAKTRLTEILKAHPRYKEDLLADLDADLPNSVPGEDQDRFAFGIAATWPDLVRSFSNPMHATFNHPNWHYIDIPYSVGGQAVNLPPDQGPAPHNAVEALAFNESVLKDPAAGDKDKAVALCWVVHLCGDIHQPLHAVELFSPQFPNGDQGGNAILVLRQPPYPDSQTKLHSLWDQLPGQYKSEEMCRDLASGLRSDPRYSRAALKDALAVTDFAAWAQESHDLAVKYAYLNGNLQGATAPDPNDAAPQQIPGLPPGYLAQAEDVALARVILAGYRTADLLNGLMDQK
jgi:hypothetical protein